MLTGATTMPRPKRNDSAVKIDAELARMARTISSYDGQTMAEYLSKLLRPILAKEFDEFQKRLEQRKKSK